MTASQQRLLTTSNVKVWAEEFMNEFGYRKQDIDEDVMIVWFANAMEIAENLDFKQVGYWLPDESAPAHMEKHRWEEARLVTNWTVEDEGGFNEEWTHKAEPVYVRSR